MKIQCTLSRTFRGMAAAPRSITARSKSLGQTQPNTFHPQATWFGSHPINPISFTSTSRAAFTSARTHLEGSSGYNVDESLKTLDKAPRPKEFPFPDVSNRVNFVGLIGEPVQFKYIDRRAFAWTTLGVRSRGSDETTWLELLFWNELAETAAQHVKKDDTLYVSGRLVSQTSAIGDYKPLKLYKVIVNRLNFIASPYQSVSEQVDVNENTPLPDVYQQAVVNRHTPPQHEESPVKSSCAGKETGEDVVKFHSLWEEFFASPDDWSDCRKEKKCSEDPDFKHKREGTPLWINHPSNPAWIDSVLMTWDMRRKASGEI